MKIAVACAGLEVAHYFTQCTNYMCYIVERGIVMGSRNIPAPDQPIESLVETLKSIEMDTIIVGLIEYDTAAVLCHSGIEVVAGAEGDAIDVVRAYVSKTLSGISEPCSIEQPA